MKEVAMNGSWYEYTRAPYPAASIMHPQRTRAEKVYLRSTIIPAKWVIPRTNQVTRRATFPENEGLYPYRESETGQCPVSQFREIVFTLLANWSTINGTVYEIEKTIEKENVMTLRRAPGPEIGAKKDHVMARRASIPEV